MLAAGGRVQPNVPHGWAETVGGELEILKRAPDENARGVYRPLKIWLAVNQKDAQTLLAQQSGGLQAGQACAHYEHVVFVHGPSCPRWAFSLRFFRTIVRTGDAAVKRAEEKGRDLSCEECSLTDNLFYKRSRM